MLCAAAAVAMGSLLTAAPAFAQSTEVGDPESTRRVYLVIIGLIVLAGLLTAFTVWFWRSTRPESKSLGRLEAMGLKRWDKADYSGRQQLLDDVGSFAGGDGPLLEAETYEPAVDEEAAKLAEFAELADSVDATSEPDEIAESDADMPAGTRDGDGAERGGETPDRVFADAKSEPAVLPGEPLI